ncbi:MAG: MFS transporter [Anaerolineales bacterium]|nr:MFS transporter [Anaerolineales bacterium]
MEISSRITSLFQQFRKSKQVFVIGFAHFVHDVYSSFFAPLLPLIIENLSLTLTQAGMLSAIQQLPAILNPLIGYMADRVSLRYFVIFAPAVTATTMSLMGVAPNYFALSMLLLVVGVSIAAFHAPTPAMIARITGNKVGMGMSVFMAFGELARMIGPLFAIWAVSVFSFHGYYPVALFGWLTSFILYTQLKDIPAQSKPKYALKNILPQIKSFFVPLVFVMIFRSFLTVSIKTFLPTLMRSQNSSFFMAGAALSVLEFAGVWGAISSGSISDKVGRKPVLISAILVASIVLNIFLRLSGVWAILILLLLGFFALSTSPVFLAMVQDHFPENRSTANGIFMTLSFLLGSLVAIIIGFLGDRIGLHATFQLSAWLCLLAIPFILLLPNEPKEALE